LSPICGTKLPHCRSGTAASNWVACNDAYVTALPGYRPKLRVELERAIGENLSSLRAEREALLEGAKAAPAS